MYENETWTVLLLFGLAVVVLYKLWLLWTGSP
jgi:hypothetical protein